MPNANVRANAQTMPDEQSVQEYDRFALAHVEWLTARASVEAADLHVGDAEMTRLTARRNAAEIALISTPSHSEETFFDKWELVEWLLSQDHIVGARTYPIAVVADAALKADFFHIGFRGK